MISIMTDCYPSIHPIKLQSLVTSSLDQADRGFSKLFDSTVKISEAGTDLGEYPLRGRLPVDYLSNHASKQWHIEARWRARKPRWRSAVEIWANPPQDLEQLRNLPNASKTAIYRKLRSCSYIPGQFCPLAAAAIYNTLGGISHVSVLDPCAGWGDRLAAALGARAVSDYLGIDANSRNQAGYNHQIDRYGDSDHYRVIHGAFEDVDIPENAFDICFTSPPYVRAEIYSNDPEQSHYRYSDFDQWLNGFLSPLITKSFNALKESGIFALNIANGSLDVGNNEVNLIKAVKQKAEETGFNPWGYLELPMGQSRIEPVFIWSK